MSELLKRALEGFNKFKGVSRHPQVFPILFWESEEVPMGCTEASVEIFDESSVETFMETLEENSAGS